jgi:hypothetical protein
MADFIAYNQECGDLIHNSDDRLHSIADIAAMPAIWQRFDIVLKLGIHRDPSIAVTLNERSEARLICGLRPDPFSKIFPFASDPNQIYICAVSSHSRGVSRSSRTRDGMRWTWAVLLTRALACGRRSRVVLTPRRWRQVREIGDVGPSGPTRRDHAGDGDKKARSPGRAQRKPLKPLRAGMPGEPVYPW